MIKIILKKDKRGLLFSDIRIFHKATIIKTVWYWCKKRHIDQIAQKQTHNFITKVSSQSNGRRTNVSVA